MSNLEFFRKGKENVISIYNNLVMAKSEKKIIIDLLNELYKTGLKELQKTNIDRRYEMCLHGYTYQCRKLLKELDK